MAFFFCLAFVQLCPKSVLFAKAKVVSQNTFAKNNLLNLRLKTLINIKAEVIKIKTQVIYLTMTSKLYRILQGSKSGKR